MDAHGDVLRLSPSGLLFLHCLVSILVHTNTQCAIGIFLLDVLRIAGEKTRNLREDPATQLHQKGASISPYKHSYIYIYIYIYKYNHVTLYIMLAHIYMSLHRCVCMCAFVSRFVLSVCLWTILRTRVPDVHARTPAQGPWSWANRRSAVLPRGSKSVHASMEKRISDRLGPTSLGTVD